MVECKRLAIAISGRGSNMEAILRACEEPGYPAEVVLVISDNPSAKGLETADAAGVTTASFRREDFNNQTDHEEAMAKAIEAAKSDLICLAGFMQVLSAEFTKKFEGRIINIHPSLLPKYKGLNTHARALADGAKTHGCSVHFVDATLDGGPVIAQMSVPILPDDDEESLAARVLTEEHRLYPEAIRNIATGEITFPNNQL